MDACVCGSQAQKARKILKLAKGFRGRRGTNYKAAKDAVVKALTHSFEARRGRKGDMRRLWISRINAAVRAEGMTYSEFMGRLNAKNIVLSRKVLADLAMNNPQAFKAVLDSVR